MEKPKWLWMSPDGKGCDYILLGNVSLDLFEKDKNFINRRVYLPSADGSTHIAYPIRRKFSENLLRCGDEVHLYFTLKQIFDEDTVGLFCPECVKAYHDWQDKKKSNFARDEVRHKANLDKKEIRHLTKNKSAAAFAEEQRELERSK